MDNEAILNNGDLDLSGVRGAKAYEASRSAAEKLVKSPDSLEKLLNNLEEKLKHVPVVGSWLSNVPVLVSMVRSYANGEYKMLPIGSLIGIVAALIYFLSPVDIIPDTIPGVGHIDDAVVIAVTMAFVGADVETYKQWKEEQQNTIEVDVEIK